MPYRDVIVVDRLCSVDDSHLDRVAVDTSDTAIVFRWRNDAVGPVLADGEVVRADS